jgi:hypothetical protein
MASVKQTLPAVVELSRRIYFFFCGMEDPTQQPLHLTHFYKSLCRAEKQKLRGIYSIVSKLTAHSSTYVWSNLNVLYFVTRVTLPLKGSPVQAFISNIAGDVFRDSFFVQIPSE